jgi:hypothetical protein
LYRYIVALRISANTLGDDDDDATTTIELTDLNDDDLDDLDDDDFNLPPALHTPLHSALPSLISEGESDDEVDDAEEEAIFTLGAFVNVTQPPPPPPPPQPAVVPGTLVGWAAAEAAEAAEAAVAAAVAEVEYLHHHANDDPPNLHPILVGRVTRPNVAGGLHKCRLRIQPTHKLETAWFHKPGKPIKCDLLVSKFTSKWVNLYTATLRRLHGRWTGPENGPGPGGAVHVESS